MSGKLLLSTDHFQPSSRIEMRKIALFYVFITLMQEAPSLTKGTHVYMLIRSINQTHVPRAEAGPYTEVIYHR